MKKIILMMMLALFGAFLVTPSQAAAPSAVLPGVNTSARAAIVQAFDGSRYHLKIAGTDWSCQNKVDRWDHVFIDNWNIEEVYVQYTNAYRNCVAPTLAHFVEPNYSLGAYNVLDRGTMTCNVATRFLNSVKFNVYFWHPYRGTNYNPGQFTIPCSPDTVGAEVQDYEYADTPRFYYGPGNGSDRQPRWKVLITYDRRAITDLEAAHWQRFNPNS